MANHEMSVKTLSRYIAGAFISKFDKYPQVPLRDICQLHKSTVVGDLCIYVCKSCVFEFNYALYTQPEPNTQYTVEFINGEKIPFVSAYLELFSYIIDGDFDVIFNNINVPVIDADLEKIYTEDLQYAMENIGLVTHRYVIFGKSDSDLEDQENQSDDCSDD